MAEDQLKPSLILACGALAREVLDLRAQLGLSEAQMVVQCLPADLHNRPGQIAPRVDAVLTARRHEFGAVLVGYGDCGTGGALDKVLAQHDAIRMPHAHCYEFFAGTPLFTEITDARIGSFFLTDFLARHFERLVWQGLGLDKMPHLLPLYFGNYTDLVHLAQTENPAITEMARAAAQRLGLDFVQHHVGYGDLASAMAALSKSGEDPAHV